jgi:hypothetical protein
MKWIPRIVLSTFLLFALATGIGYAQSDPAPPTNDGIGTSPSADDEPAAAAPSTTAELLVCGVWLDTSLAAADARSLAGEPPDILVFPSEHTTCSDAVSIAWNLYPGRAFVRAVVWQGWRAREASTPHALLQLRRFERPRAMHAAFPIIAILELLSPLITAIVGKVFATKVKDVNRRAQIAGYADTAFHVVEAVGKQYGWDGADKYNHFIQQVIDSVKASGGPELTGPEMAQLQQLATAKALMAKVHAVLPPTRPLPLPPPPRG